MAEAPKLSNAGLALALAAIAVNSPRLVLAFLEADGIAVSEGLRASLLGLTGIATGVVLTGGSAYLAHVLARGVRPRNTLLLTWLLILTCTGILVTPMLVASLARRPLAEVVRETPMRWGWSAIAVLAVELVAAGAMVAHGARRNEQGELDATQEELLQVAAERNRLATHTEKLTAERDAMRAEIDALRKKAKKRKTAEPIKHASEKVETFPCRNGCGAVFASSLAERGHLKNCPLRAKER